MAMTTREKNQLECNKAARKRYNKSNYKYQSICFKNEELDAINAYCERNNIQKNTLLREAAMNAIGKSLE